MLNVSYTGVQYVYVIENENSFHMIFVRCTLVCSAAVTHTHILLIAYFRIQEYVYASGCVGVSFDMVDLVPSNLL